MAEPERDDAPKPTAAQSMLSLYLPALILGLGSSIAAPALPVYAKSFDVSFGVASLAIIVYGLGSTVATVPTGYLVDRLGRRKIVLAGPIMTALTSFLVVTAQSFPELLVYRFLGGWALQMWMLGRLAMITDTGGERRGRQITGMYGMDSTGRLLGPAVGGFAAAAWDIRVPFILHGILALLAIVPSFRLVRETNPAAQRTAERTESGTVGWRATAAQLLAVPVLMIFLVQLLASLTRGSIWGGTLDLYVVYAYGLGPEALGLLVAVTSAIGVPITFGIGHVMDRFGRKATLVPGLVLLGLGLLSTAVTAFASLAFSVYAVSLFLVRAAVSATSGTMQVLASDVAPPQGRGRFLGAWRLVSELGGLLSPVAFAVLSEGYGFGVAFLFLSLTSLGAAFVLGALVKETLAARRQQVPLASGS